MTSRLFGEESHAHFLPLDGSGAKTNPGEAIFPIVIQDSAGRFRVVGSGFFIGPMGIFATAAHVIQDCLDESGSPLGAVGALHLMGDNEYSLRQFVTATRSEVSDVAVGRFQPLFHKATGEPLHNRMVTLRSVPPLIGEAIHSFAFPKSEVAHGERTKISVNPRYFGGILRKHFPQGRDVVMLPGPCFETSMAIHGGASGAPVFASDGKVFGINSASFQDEPLSFVSCISSILDLGIDGIKLGEEKVHRKVTVRELREKGLLADAIRSA